MSLKKVSKQPASPSRFAKANVDVDVPIINLSKVKKISENSNALKSVYGFADSTFGASLARLLFSLLAYFLLSGLVLPLFFIYHYVN